MDIAHGQNAMLRMGGCNVMFTGEVIFGDLIAPSYLYALQVPWPPRSMAGSLKRWLRWEKWSSKTLRGAVRPTDKPGGRGDAHGHAFPTRGPCRSRARWFFFLQSGQERDSSFLIKESASYTMYSDESLCGCTCVPDILSNFMSSQSYAIPERIWAKALHNILSHNCWLVRKHSHWREGIWC